MARTIRNTSAAPRKAKTSKVLRRNTSKAARQAARREIAAATR